MREGRIGLVVAWAVLVVGCAGSQPEAPSPGGGAALQGYVAGGEATGPAPEMDAYAYAPTDQPPSSQPAARGGMAPQPRLAQVGGGATPPTPAPSGPAPTKTEGKKPLLVYTATVVMAVYEVDETQEAVLGIARELDGYLEQQSGSQLTVRLPAAKFQEALGRIEQAGDVLNKTVQARDVTAQFTDLQIRLKNAEAMRDRLEQLLTKANTVEDALKIERELERLTTSIETMKGQLRLLSDQIAYSTITVVFQPRSSEKVTDEFRLPFEWLDQLGLQRLLRLQ